MSDILNTGKSALFAFQRALTTTSHNIANVNTEGYSRQRVNFEAVSGGDGSLNYIGGGVRVRNIQRIYDEFATSRVNTATSAHAEQQTHHAMASQLDNIVTSDGVSVTPAINDLFNALEDANNDAASMASREVVLNRTEQLANRFNSLQTQFDEIQTEVNDRTRAAVESISGYAQSIADINRQVVGISGSRNVQAANDLLDQRDQLVKELSKFVDVKTIIQDNGAMNVFAGKGISLVVDSGAQTISVQADDTYPDRLQIQIGSNGNEKKLSPRLMGGEIGGLSEFTDNTLYPATHELGRLSLIMADQLNQQHARGVDLDGETGTDLFTTEEPQAFSSRSNAGTGIVTATISDTSLLKASDYLLRYDGANFTATRNSDGAQTSSTLPTTLDGIDISFTGTPVAGDTFIVSATGHAAATITSVLTEPDKLALASQLSTSSSIDNLGESRIGNANVVDPASASLKDPIDIIFTSDTSYDIVDVNSSSTLVSGATYTPGDNIAFNGWEVSISGNALAGDTHRIEATVNGRGNNINGLQLSDMQLTPIVDGRQSFNDAYGTMVSRVGSNTRSAESRTSALEALRDNAIDRQQASQGVSLDEEAIDLTRYQQAYQASAQIIAASDVLFQAILGAVR